VLVGSTLSFIGAYVSVAFLTRYFRTRSLRPFGVYCLIAAAVSLVALAIP
jgi:undecaprenyl-diphosphatase